MSKMQREKGKRGERMFASLLTDQGFGSRRGCQYKGGPDSPDVVCPSLPIHWEVKYTERLNLREAYNQADLERQLGDIPVVAWKKNNSIWLVTLSAEDLCDILRQSDLPTNDL